MTRLAWIVALACGCGLHWGFVDTTRGRAEDPLFSAEFADGAYVAGGRIAEWHDTNAQPKLNGVPILDPARPIRWLHNESAEPASTPNAFVELFGGDRLPGRVLQYLSGQESFADRLPPHLVVRPDVVIDHPQQPAREQLRVAVQAVRRVVWQRRPGDHYAPNTLYYLDGRQVSFRSLRWADGGVNLLLKEGPRKVLFSEIAELHLPQRSSWDAYFEALAVLSPSGAARLMRIETFGGLIATTSLERFQARAVSGDPAGWFHLVQPAWSLDPIWVQHTRVNWRQFFLPHEVPLTMIEPRRVVERSSLGGGWTWQKNRNVEGQPLRSAKQTYGWGLGVHAYCELEFELPPCVQSFQSRLGLDEAVGRGGCARGLVYANQAGGAPLFKSNHLIGSAAIVETGSLALAGPAGGQKSLLLVADPAHADRPPGADPLDIRDMVDWLEPRIVLNADPLRAEIARRLPQAIPAWKDWTVSANPPAQLELSNRWDQTDPKEARYRTESLARGGHAIYSRRVQVSPQQKYWSILVSRFPEGTEPSRMEMRIDGNPVAEFEVRERRPGVPLDPLLIPLARYQGKQVSLEIEETPKSDRSKVEWRGLDLVESTTPTAWVPLEVREAKSSGDATLTREPDQTIFASGKQPDIDTYTVTCETALEAITAIRLEVLSDPRLPGRGPGRAGNGNFVLTDFRATAEPLDKSAPPQPVEFASARADFSNPDAPIAQAIDKALQTGWCTQNQPSQSHLAIFTTRGDAGFAGGTRLVFTLDHRAIAQHAIGRFRLSATRAARPVPVERPGVVAPTRWIGKALAVFEDQADFVADLNQGSGTAALEVDDKHSGAASIKIAGEQRFNQALPNFSAKIRQNPAAGEYRFLRFAWKKRDGATICIQLAHDGQWGPAGAAKFRYHAGGPAEAFGASVQVGPALPAEWTVVTRDLFADFGEFTLTGFSLAPIDGTYGLFDSILLGRAAEDFEQRD